MALSRSKLAIIGIGNVGTALAHQLVISNTCDDLVLIDLNKGKVWAEVTDLKHSLGYSEANMQIVDGDYEDCKNADIVVLAVAAPYKLGMTRLDMMEKATSIVKSIVPKVMASGFSGIFVVITNPVDAMTYLVQQLSGLPSNQVFGTGTSLDSARLRHFLADTMEVDPRSVEAMCMGEHGDSQMIPWSQVTVGGKSFTDILEDNPERLDGIAIDGVSKEIAQIAYEIIKNKGATNYGIAAVAAKIVKAIIRDENMVMPVSAMLNGEYGLSGLYAGIPAVITGKGIKELVHYRLTKEELEDFKSSVEVLRMTNKKMMGLLSSDN